MDNDHNLIITPKGQYQYDSDFDIYRRVPEESNLSHLQQFGWIYVLTLILAFILAFKTF